MDKYDEKAKSVFMEFDDGPSVPYLEGIAKALRESAADAYEDAANKAEEYRLEGLAAPIMSELRAIFINKAASLRGGRKA